MAKKRRSSGTNTSRLAGCGFAVLIILIIIAGFLGIDVNQLLEEVSDVVVEPTLPQSRPPATDSTWYELYFTDPTCPDESNRAGGVDEIIANDMLAAQNRVDIASFDLDSVPMIEALIALEGRGVEVRVIVDNEHTPAATINRLRRNGISVTIDDRSALMHNKFVVIDGRYVWTGSMNFTTNGVYCNNNNIARFDAPQLAANYTAEMEEMYIDHQFGPRSPQNTTSTLTVNGITLENYFASEEAVGARLSRIVSRANNEILFMAFSFTQEDIGEAMIERAEAGLTVRGVYETSGSETRFSYYGAMKDMGLNNMQVRQDGNPRVMHHKVIIVDRSIVIFGSYNFSGSAEDSNDENVIIVHDPEFASYFVEEFEAVWAEGK